MVVVLECFSSHPLQGTCCGVTLKVRLSERCVWVEVRKAEAGAVTLGRRQRGRDAIEGAAQRGPPPGLGREKSCLALW